MGSPSAASWRGIAKPEAATNGGGDRAGQHRVHQPQLAPERLGPRQVWLLMGGLMTGMLLAALDQTIVGTALPTIVGKLGGIEHYSWVVTSYLLASTASTPLYGKTSDLYGRRPILLFAISTFLVGSLLAGVSQNMTQLIIFRGIQGVGAGGLLTLAFTVISDVVTPRERGKYVGLFGAVFGLSSIAGPLAGGYFAETDWRWIFYINLPLGIAALFICNSVLKAVPQIRHPHAIDWLGAALMVTSVSSLLLALSWGGTQYAWSSPTIITLFGVAAVHGTAFLYVESRASEPILPLRLFKRRTFTLATAGTYVLGFAMFGSIIYIPLYLQIVKGASPTESGLLMLPMMGGVIFASVVSGRIISHLGRYKWFPVAGTVIMTVALLTFRTLEVHTPLWRAFILMAAFGIGMGMSMQPLITAVQNAVERRDLGAGTSTATFARSLGGALGVAALGTLLTNRLSAELPGFGTSGGPSINEPAAIHTLPSQIVAAIQHGFVDALHPVFLVAALVSAVGVLLSLALPDRELHGPPTGPPEASGEAEVDEAEAQAAAVI